MYRVITAPHRRPMIQRAVLRRRYGDRLIAWFTSIHHDEPVIVLIERADPRVN